MNHGNNEDVTSNAGVDTTETGGAGGFLRIGKAAGYIVLTAVACLAISSIVLLAAAYGIMQFGPGGIMSDVRAGKPAPDFEVQTLDGGTIRLEDYEGKLIALNFWATWCPPCVQELPLLDQAQERHADAGLAVIAMNAGQTRKHVTSFLDGRDLDDLPVAMDPGREVYEAYGVVGLPTTVWIDREGNVYAVEIGGLTQEVIDKYVAEMLEAEKAN